MTAPVFFVDRTHLAGHSHVVLDGGEGRHAATVRRIRRGERVDLGDGAGLVAECVVSAVAKDRLEIEVMGVRELPRPQPRVVVVQALPKGGRGELAVELMTEAGVDAIVPWSAARCIARWRAERGTKALTRWRSAAREAAKQARRAWLPEVHELASTDEVAALLKTASAAFVLNKAGTVSFATGRTLPDSGDVVLVVGPEGGITPDELATFEAAGATSARLGPTVLRSSTAGVVAAAVALSRSPRW